MPHFKSECRKFQPNIFNKIKCANCFKQREEHSAEALESNRASRKVSKCGYLFVAPDWDFSIPLNRTKRWQRRWFVLYDDGELTYSVDDLPATIPQGVIDMNRVLEVSEAEDVTGNQFALTITSPDRATFVKGTCREESRWWYDVLSVFTRAQKQYGRHKRNATFPGIKSSSSVQSRASLSRTPSPAMAPTFDSSGQRIRFRSESLNLHGRPSSAPTLEGDEDVFSMKDQPIPSSVDPSPPTPIYHSTPIHSSLPPSTRLSKDDHKENTPPYTNDYYDHPPTSESPPTQDKVLGHRPRTRRTAKREAKGLTNPRSELPRKLLISELDDSKRDEKLKDIADSITRVRSNSSNLIYSKKESKDKPTREKDSHADDISLCDNTPDATPSFLATFDRVRGDPDGCGLDGVSITSGPISDIQRVELPAEDLLYIKKGWLLKQGHTKELNKYWFVLQGSSLRFYRDPSAEDNGILDGIVDLGMAKDVEECDVSRNYGFKIIMWDDTKCIFSAVTSGIRSNWIQALRNAANLKDKKDRSLTLGEKIEREIGATKEKESMSLDPEIMRDGREKISKSHLSNSYFSSDDDFKTASETMLSNVSYKMKNLNSSDIQDRNSRTNTRNCPSKRSRSSPPSSRRTTRDDFPTVKENASCFSESDSLHSINDIGKHEYPEKGSSGTLANSGENLLVDLLETQVESLKAKLEQTQVEELQEKLACQEIELEDNANIIAKFENLKKQFEEEKKELQKKMSDKEQMEVLSPSSPNHTETIDKLARALRESETNVSNLKEELKNLKMNSKCYCCKKYGDAMDLNKQVIQLTTEVRELKENAKHDKSEVYKWKDLVKELRSLLDGRNEDMDRKREEMEDLRETLKSKQCELDQTADRLYRGIEENENLCSKLREMERQINENKARRASSNLSISSSREKFSSRRNLPRMDSLSDLTNYDMNLHPEDLDREGLVEEYLDLRARFEKAVNEVKALKREIRDAHHQQDDLELMNQRFKKELRVKEEDYNSEIGLMSARIQDLTMKLSNSEKQVRLLKQKITRTESKERRRTHSLKGKESFSLSRDIEGKLSQLEMKLEALLNGQEIKDSTCKATKVAKRSKSFEESTKSSRLRRKSLDGQTNEDAMKTIVRINQLDAKITGLSGEGNGWIGSSSTNSSSNTLSTPLTTSTISSGRARSPTHPVSPLRSPMRSPSSLRKNLRSPRATPEKIIKTSRPESEAKLLRDRISANEKLFAALQAKLNECSTWAEAIENTCTCNCPSLRSLQKQVATSIRLVQCRSRDSSSTVNRLQPLALRLHEMLKDKMSQLMQRKYHLKSTGKWTREAQLKSFAERLAYETLILSQLGQAHQASIKPDSYEASVKLQDLIEAHRKLSFLEKRLTNPDFDMEPSTPLEFYTSLLAEKLVVEGDVISCMTNLKNQKSNETTVNETCRDLQMKALERERSVANIFNQYKEEKLHEIAVVMAKETVTGTQPHHDDNVLLEELRIREAWTIAQDLLTQELVNLEASQSLVRLTYLFSSEPATTLDHTTQLSSSTSDKLQTGAEESLRQEMEESVFTLSNKYEEVLAQYRYGNTGIINSVSVSMDAVLSEFASVISQKALIDGQLAISTGDETLSTLSDSLTIVEESRDPLESATDVVASEAHLLMFLGSGDSSLESLVQSAMNQAEFTFLYNKLSGQCVADISNAGFNGNKESSSVRSINSSASDRDVDVDIVANKIPPSPKTKRKMDSVGRKSRRVSDITGMLEKCRQCDELRQDMSRLRRALDSKRTKKQEADCRKCIEYLKTIKNLEESHREATEALKASHKAETDRLRDQVKYDPPTRDSDDELTELKRRLCLLEEGYECQISTLKKQYEEALGSQSDVCEESVRQRYQLEIEHLRGLCEKGLAAMENSHRRMVLELEEKHIRELSSLQIEKEQALAEETKATLAALDAMRKAHEAEVQREVSKFKEEFLRKTESGLDIGDIHRRHEEEMAGIRKEILDLSEKYSLKCLESASLEEKLESLSKKLTEANRHSTDLESRNKQLKSQLSNQVLHMQHGDSHKDMASRLKQKEDELILKKEEISHLNQLLRKSQLQEQDLNELCGQLGHFLKTERQLRTGEVSALKDKLEHLILTTAKFQDEHRSKSPRCRTEITKNISLETSCGREVTRSPSCPRLSGFSSFLANGSFVEGTGPPPGTPKGRDTPPLPSPLLGMVASRKKVFETPEKNTPFAES